MDLEVEPYEARSRGLGAKTLEDLTWRHLLDPLACTEWQVHGALPGVGDRQDARRST